jgi:alginate O-acetyltransferase complex protein AlgI
MLASFQILVVTAVVLSFAYGALPGRGAWIEVRRALILVVSAVLIYTFNPRALAIAVLVTLLAWGLYALARRHPQRGWIPWLVMAPMAVNAVTEVAFDRNWGDILPFPTGSPVSPMIMNLATLGLSFYSFKLYASIKEGMRVGELPFRDLLTTTLFFPAFPIGPIDSSQRYNREALSRDPDLRRWLLGLARIGMGGAKVFLVAAWITTTIPEALGIPTLGYLETHAFRSPEGAILFTALAFLNLYLNFSGFTDIAIGSAMLFNLHLTENFRYPLLSHSIQNFWQRWHLSLAAFITRYMFKPMLRRTGRPVVSLIVVFTLIGLWHEVSVGYLIWGLAHGTALGATLWWRTRRQGRPGLLPKPILRVGGVVVTLAFVSFLSTLANMPSLARMRDYLGAFVGL